jgi:probable F420-dependent oxidoreductase
MKIGLIPVNVGVRDMEQMAGLAKKAESVGFESLWTFEHVVIPDDYDSKYPYSNDGKMPVTSTTNFVDPLISIAALASETTTIRFATGVNILSQSNPLLLAKQAASLDFVSGGRFMLGLGIGWLREEFDAMGVPFDRRGARFDDAVEAMRKVWSGDVVEHQSDFLSWSGFRSHPLPGNLPVVIGGTKGKVFVRTARLGDGYFAPNQGVDQMKALIEELDRACSEVGRKRDEIEITGVWMGPAEGEDAIARYRDLGVSRLVAMIPALGKNPIEDLDPVGEIIAKL